ncbi:MAG: Lipopolysaccharide ABC transporter, ATP-binding protein LptB [uncultured Thermomicrobiales bacterium]|uniref:Lipopolysaccharide ABC transporter, ATP-binding protein LptB n=1 Tax=uncultured Thermomicrobiales bacterium TaxID=1645740 RepID=A0A6J4UJD2_9BACT|nr:MAG: Lipopolysaccharide ABC transporter, ATP-binding protein LptB [uncultured Thermomicrobiales bacterium]
MLTVNSVSKRFGALQILESVSFSINPGDRLGLIGPNGAGKSTLLRIIAGQELANSGTVAARPEIRIGYLRQGFADMPDGTLAELIDLPLQGLIAAQAELERTIMALGDPNALFAEPGAAYAVAQDRFDAVGGYETLDRLSSYLGRFGLADMSLDRPLSTLSGGQKTRAGLAALLASHPHLLILDEPTNHLDIDALDWLATFLNGYGGAVLMVSHDRRFLDATLNQILELDPETHRLTVYAGTYSDYVTEKERERVDQAAAYHRQQKEIARIEADIRGAEHHARTIEANSIDFAVRKKAAKIARPAVVRKRKLERLLESTEHVERPERKWRLAVDFSSIGPGSRDAVVLEDVRVAYGNDRVLDGCSLHVSDGDRIAITGRNGAGKSTLMRVIAKDIVPDFGSVRLGPSVRIGYFAQEQDTLDANRTVLAMARAIAAGSESDIRTFLHKFLFSGEMVHHRIGDLSYGERARLMLAALVLRGSNLLLLDEPLNHLDLDARERFEEALEQFAGTIVFVSHDRYTIRRLASRVVEVRDGRVIERDSDAEPEQAHG